MRVAIIGAGISGLSCARHLQEAGAAVTVFDKGRGPGGRLSTRRGAIPFDHGAQYFTTRDADFQTLVARWMLEGLVAEWTGRIVVFDHLGGPLRVASELPRLVGVPGMAALAAAMTAGLDVRQSVTVAGLDRADGAWRLRTADETLPGDFDVVALTPPPPQTAALLGSHPLAAQVRVARMAPCWSVMAAWDGPLAVDWDAAFVNEGPLGWVARDGSKPRRPHPHAWVLHASPDWSTAHLEAAPEDVSAELLEAFAVVAGPLPPPTHLHAHRWRYASVSETLEARSLWDADSGVGVAGDYCRGPRVEGAWLSGRDLARRILGEH